MKKSRIITLTLLSFVLNASSVFAQQGIGTNTPSKASVLDLQSEAKGLLIPRIALKGISDFTVINGATGTDATNTNSLLVFNTATNPGVTPGFYYWTSVDTKWNRLVASNEVSAATLVGDVNGSIGANTISKIQNQPVTFTGATAGQVIAWNGTGWVPTSLPAQKNIYTDNGTLTGNRLVTQGTNTLSFSTAVAGGTKFLSDGTAIAPKSAIQIKDGSEANGKILSSDASGNASWIAAPVIDLRKVGTNNHITQDAGVGSNGTSVGSGTDNIAIGNLSLSQNTTGSSNIGLGSASVKSMKDGSFNLAIGDDAMSTRSNGSNNIALGSSAMSYGTVTNTPNATYNIGIGAGSLRRVEGSSNIGIGQEALSNTTTGERNIAFMFNALEANTTGSNNIAFGFSSLFKNVSTSNNISLGAYSMYGMSGSGGILEAYSTADAGNNIALGKYSLSSVSSTTRSSIAIGNESLGFNQSGFSDQFSVALGNQSLRTYKTGFNNLGLGTTAGTSFVNGNNNTFLGANSGVTSIATNYVFASAMGAGATVGASNSIVLGRTPGFPVSNTVQDNVGIGTVTPSNPLHVKATTNPVKFEGLQNDATATNFVMVGSDGVLKTITKNSQDGTNDAWVNNTTNTRVELGTKADGTARNSGTDAFFTDSGRLGIGLGNDVPDGGLHLVGDGDGFKDDIRMDSYSGGDSTPGANFRFHGARGTKAAPKAVLAGDVLGQFNFWSHDGTSFGSLSRARISSQYRSTAGADLIFSTGGATNNTMVITETGNVGIGTSTPVATLDITGQPTNISKLDAVVPPRITGDQLKAKTYTTLQDGAIVYVTTAAEIGNQTGQTINVNMPGIYYFDKETMSWAYLGSNPIVTNYRSTNYQALNTTATTDQTITFGTGDKLVELATTFNDSEDTFTIKYDGYYQISAFIGFNANQPDFSSARDYVAVNLKIQVNNRDEMGIRQVFSGITAGVGTSIQVPTTVLKLTKGSVIKFVIQRPDIIIGTGSNGKANSFLGIFAGGNNGHINLPGGQTYTKSLLIMKIK